MGHLTIRTGHRLAILLGLISFLVVAWVSDVHILEALKYLGYSILYVLFPGWCFYRVLMVNAGNVLRQICLGWTLGYVLETAVYLLMPNLKIFGVDYVALIIIGICIPFLYLKLRNSVHTLVKEQVPQREILAYVFIAVLVIITMRFYSIVQVPLPSESRGVSYYQDLVWHLSLASEAKWHNLPFQNPSVSGESLRYYLFPHIHMAVASRISGIELSKILLRLFPLELYFLWALMLCWAARELIRKTHAPLLYTSLVLLLGSLTGSFAINSARKIGSAPLYEQDYFLNYIFWTPFNSPTFLFGTIFF